MMKEDDSEELEVYLLLIKIVHLFNLRTICHFPLRM